MSGLIGRKIGMTSIFDESGKNLYNNSVRWKHFNSSNANLNPLNFLFAFLFVKASGGQESYERQPPFF